MNWFDLLLILAIIAGVAMGFQRGFIRAAIELLVLLTSIVLAAQWYEPLGSRLGQWLEIGTPLQSIIAFMLLGFGSLAALGALSSMFLLPMVASARSIAPFRFIDSLAGIIPGLIYGLLLGVLLTLMIGLIPGNDTVNRALASSDIASRLRLSAQDLTMQLARHTGMDLADFVYVVVPDDNEGYSLPSIALGDLDASETDEQQMLEMLNAEREKNGLPSLGWDAELQAVARGHSTEMMRLGYFSHTSPETGTLGDRLAAASVGYTVAGENLAYAPSVSVAHRGLMQSDGHRANILSPDFDRVGIGAIVADDGTKMFTQVFAR